MGSKLFNIIFYTVVGLIVLICIWGVSRKFTEHVNDITSQEYTELYDMLVDSKGTCFDDVRSYFGNNKITIREYELIKECIQKEKDLFGNTPKRKLYQLVDN